MLRRVSALVIKQNMVLLVKLKDQDRMLPRATWIFPTVSITEDDSPRRVINILLDRIGIDYKLKGDTFRYVPAENPKLSYVLYAVDYVKGEPDVASLFQTYKWVQIRDIVAYSTSFMDANISKYLNGIADTAEKFRN